LIPEPIGSFTHAITIRSPRRVVWPWLAQMGAGSRAGWYSYDLLDNGRRPSPRRVQPELQSLSLGMIFPALPGATDCFELLAFEPPRLLILGWRAPGGAPRMTWAFVLEDAAAGGTRLLVRVRGSRAYHLLGLPWWLARRFVGTLHFVMQRKQLLGIARRAEAA
jgi:hypothetical protein